MDENEDWYWWKWFHVAKTEMEYWRFRCAMSSRRCVYADQLMAVLPQVMTWNRTKRKGSGLTPTALTDIKCLTNLDINILYQWPRKVKKYRENSPVLRLD